MRACAGWPFMLACQSTGWKVDTGTPMTMVSIQGSSQPSPNPPLAGSASDTRRFWARGAHATSSVAAVEKEYGLLRALTVIWKNFRKTENLKMATGLFLRDGLPRAVDLGLLFPPFGWVVTVASHLGPKQLSARSGERIIDTIKKAHPEGVPGPLAKFEELQAITRNPKAFHKVEAAPETRVWQNWINKYNDMLTELFHDEKMQPEQATKIEKAVRRLHIKEDKFVGRRIRDYFLVRLDYTSKRLGRVVNFLLRNEVANRHTTGVMGRMVNFLLRPVNLLRRIPIVKWPFLAAGALLQGGLMVRISHRLKKGQLSHLA